MIRLISAAPTRSKPARIETIDIDPNDPQTKIIMRFYDPNNENSRVEIRTTSNTFTIMAELKTFGHIYTCSCKYINGSWEQRTHTIYEGEQGDYYFIDTFERQDSDNITQIIVTEIPKEQLASLQLPN